MSRNIIEFLTKAACRSLLYTPITDDQYWCIAENLHCLNNHDVDQYNIDINPYDIKYVDPKKIQYVTGRSWKPWSKISNQFGKVMSGNWDCIQPTGIPEDRKPYPRDFTEHVFYISIRNHFERDVPWTETELYHWLATVRDRSEEHILEHFDHIDNLYNQIQSKGYRSQKALFKKDQTFLSALSNEVLVDIGRNGEILFVDGRHRLSIAKVLNLSFIPVVVLIRHEKWIESCEEKSKEVLCSSI